MAQLSKTEFDAKWDSLFADNEIQHIDEPMLRAFKQDIADSFALLASVSATPVAPAVNFDPVLRQLTASHPLGPGELEYTHNNGGFTAYAAVPIDDGTHAQGEWRFRVQAAAGRNASQTTDSPPIAAKAANTPAGPGTIKSTMISDSTVAGRALLTAKDVPAQRLLLDKLNLVAEQYGVGQPKFDTLYGDAGALAYLLGRLANQGAPAAPANGRVDDTANTLSGDLVPGYPAAGDYEVFGVPTYPGNVLLTATGGDVQNGRVISRGLTGAILAGGTGIRVAASGNRPAGAWLLNSLDFTGLAPAPTPAPTPAPAPAPTTYTATQQSYTTTAEDYQAACNKAYQGTYAGVTRTNSSQTSTSSQADANAKALAVATQDAKYAITCQVDPVAYDNQVAAGQTLKGVTLGAQSGDTLEFNNAAGADNSGITMELWLTNEQVASVPYENYYTGKPFRYAHNGTKYTKNFTAGRVDL